MNYTLRSFISRVAILSGATLIFHLPFQSSLAQSVVNAGFNDTTGWILNNDADLANPGGVAPWTWTTLVAPKLINVSETVLPTEGSGMAITYAGIDSYVQSVNIAQAGMYTLSVDANALSGSLTQLGSLVSGQFRFQANGVFSPVFTLLPESSWETLKWTSYFDSGSRTVGIYNYAGGVYSIAYDNFSLTIPEPTSLRLLAVVGFLLTAPRRKFFCQRDDVAG